MSEQRSRREIHSRRHPADPLPDETAESGARKKLRRLWQAGDLFHVASRYPRQPNAPKVDRLAGILKSGLIAPARCQDGSVRSDLHIVVTGCCVPYDSLIFLHLFGRRSYLYTICDPGRFAVFVDPKLPVMKPEAMGPTGLCSARMKSMCAMPSRGRNC